MSKFTLKVTTQILYPESCTFTTVSEHATEDEAVRAMRSASAVGRYIVTHPQGGYVAQRFVTGDLVDKQG